MFLLLYLEKVEKKLNLNKKTSDKDLIHVIQQQYRQYRAGGHFQCSCGQRIDYDTASAKQDGKILMKVKCSSCSENVEKFISKYNYSFDSEEFNFLLDRYELRIKRRCEKMKIEDPVDMWGDMSHRFFISVVTYSPDSNCKFTTYMWNNIRRRFEDFERKNARACKNNSVQCQCCGRYVGAITRIHLYNNKIKSKPGFPGHKVLHDSIIAELGEEKWNLLNDDQDHSKTVKWQGNDYSKAQGQFVRPKLVAAYKQMFPRHDISLRNVSISDCDPKTEVEYINIIADKRDFEISSTGYYINTEGTVVGDKEVDEGSIFVPDRLDKRFEDLCKHFSLQFSSILHHRFLHDKSRKSFKNTRDKAGLENFLVMILPYMAKGYTKQEIGSILGLDVDEVGFWLKNIKKSKEIRKSLNLQ